MVVLLLQKAITISTLFLTLTLRMDDIHHDDDAQHYGDRDFDSCQAGMKGGMERIRHDIV